MGIKSLFNTIFPEKDLIIRPIGKKNVYENYSSKLFFREQRSFENILKSIRLPEASKTGTW